MTKRKVAKHVNTAMKYKKGLVAFLTNLSALLVGLTDIIDLSSSTKKGIAVFLLALNVFGVVGAKNADSGKSSDSGTND